MKQSSRIQLIDRGTDEFIEKYYKTFDSVRHFIMNFYSEQAKLLWNGNPIPSDQLNAFFSQTPSSQHTIDSYDAQPMSEDTFLVHSNGQVVYGTGEIQRLFAHTFILRQEERTKIIYEHFRFINE